MPANEICYMTAAELARRIKSGVLSAKEVMEFHLAQIERVNPKAENAPVQTLSPDPHRDEDTIDRWGHDAPAGVY